MTTMDSSRLPEDWATNFDLYDEEYLKDPYAIWRAMRAAGCPVAHSTQRGGAALPIRHEDIVRIAHDPQTFSSRALEATGHVPPRGRELQLPPITSDPPEHEHERRALLPLFTKPRIRELEALTQARARGLVDGFIDRGSVDVAEEYARHIPVTVIAEMLGVPPSDAELFDHWIVQFLKVGPQDYAVRVEAIKSITAYFTDLIAHQRAAGAGIVGYLMAKRDGGQELTDSQIVGMCFLLLVAGIDTTWSAIGSGIWHLATHPDDRRRLVDDPSLMDTAIEEILRAYAPITIARAATRTVEIGDAVLSEGDRVLLSWAAANRDPEVFDRAEEVLIDREENRHLAFGLGIHRCIGSNLARMELKVALTEWLRRIPEFSLAEDAVVTWSGGNVRGPESLPVVFPVRPHRKVAR